jgi:tetratricopeptide (TPR) repeat protein
MNTLINFIKAIGCSEEEIKKIENQLNNPPSNFYRYRAIGNDKSLRYFLNEIKGTISLSPHSKLNDPLDLKSSCDYTSIKDFVELIRRHPITLLDPGFSASLDSPVWSGVFDSENPYETLMENFSSFSNSCGISLTEERLQYFSEQLVSFFGDMDTLMQSINIACFTDSYANLPMWNNYAHGYKGVCVEYEYDSIGAKLKPVVYIDKLPGMFDALLSIKESNLINNNYSNDLTAFFQIKTKAWENEHEWRMFTMADAQSAFTEMLSENFEKMQDMMTISDYYLNNNSTGEFPDYFTGEMNEELLEQYDKLPENIKEAITSVSALYSKAVEKLGENHREEFKAKPSKVFLGDRIDQDYQKTIIDCAAENNVKVFKMHWTEKGYEPITIEGYEIEKILSDIRKVIKKSEDFFNKQDYYSAIYKANSVINQAKEHSPQYFERLLHLKAKCIQRLHPTIEAQVLQCYKELIEVEPQQALYNFELGIIYRQQLKDFKSSIEQNRLAIAKAPAFAYGHINLAYSYLEDDRFDEAKQALETGYIRCSDFVSRLNSDEESIKLANEDKRYLELFSSVSFSKEIKISEMSAV